MLQPFPGQDSNLNGTNWLNWFSKLRQWVNNRPIMVVYNTATQAVNSGVLDTITLNGTKINVGSPWDGTLFTAPMTGIYEVMVVTQAQNNTNNQATIMSLLMYKNGISYAICGNEQGAVAGHKNFSVNTISTHVPLVTGDTLRIYMYNGGAGIVTILNDGLKLLTIPFKASRRCIPWSIPTCP